MLVTRVLGATAVIGAALALAYVSSGLTGPCGGYRACGVDSTAVLISALAWLGFVGVVAAVLISLSGSPHATAVSLAIIACTYSAWLLLVVARYV
jgi:hypothetical protein